MEENEAMQKYIESNFEEDIETERWRDKAHGCPARLGARCNLNGAMCRMDKCCCNGKIQSVNRIDG